MQGEPLIVYDARPALYEGNTLLITMLQRNARIGMMWTPWSRFAGLSIRYAAHVRSSATLAPRRVAFRRLGRPKFLMAP